MTSLTNTERHLAQCKDVVGRVISSCFDWKRGERSSLVTVDLSLNETMGVEIPVLGRGFPLFARRPIVVTLASTQIQGLPALVGSALLEACSGLIVKMAVADKPDESVLVFSREHPLLALELHPYLRGEVQQ